MDQTEVKRKLPQIAEKIVKDFKPDKIILFGSYAWGKPGPDSDVDLFVIKETSQSKLERGQDIERILWGSGIPIDALVYTPEETKRRLELNDFFIKRIFKKGKVLFTTS